jgi:hypothetical protein
MTTRAVLSRPMSSLTTRNNFEFRLYAAMAGKTTKRYRVGHRRTTVWTNFVLLVPERGKTSTALNLSSALLQIKKVHVEQRALLQHNDLTSS